MVRLNNVEYDYVPGKCLKEVVDIYNTAHPIKVGFEEFIVIVKSTAIGVSQAPERVLQDNDNVFIFPQLDGG